MFNSQCSIKNTVYLPYNVIYQSPTISSVEEAKIVLIGEYHLPQWRLLNNSIIDRLSTPGSVLLVESAYSLTELEGRQREWYLSILEISTFARKRFSSVIGWDGIDRKNYNFSNVTEEIILRDFPKRTEAMIKTIDAVFKRDVKGKIFLIAGMSHLQESQLFEHPNYSLKSLYEKLEHLPAVILSF